MRILGIDYGTVRTGLAISDPLGIIAQPLETIKADSLADLITKITTRCQEKEVEQIVIGLPRHMSGEESEGSSRARKLGDQLTGKLALPVIYQDERLSTAAAKRVMSEAAVSRKKRREKIDSVAATIILQNYLDSQES